MSKEVFSDITHHVQVYENICADIKHYKIYLMTWNPSDKEFPDRFDWEKKWQNMVMTKLMLLDRCCDYYQIEHIIYLNRTILFISLLQ